MDFYNDKKTATKYIALADGYDGKILIDALAKHAPKGASVLELGMGPGKDLDILNKRYVATGSDTSAFFIKRYARLHPRADLLTLDAVTLETTRHFDCIYSNKVLHHLNAAALAQSLKRQARVLNPRGWILHSFWRGQGMDEIQGMQFYYYDEADLHRAFATHYDIIALVPYKEMETNDSIYLLARGRSDQPKG